MTLGEFRIATSELNNSVELIIPETPERDGITRLGYCPITGELYLLTRDTE